MDIYAVSDGEMDDVGNKVYHTGLAIEIPQGYVGLIYPRSSISKTTHMLRNHVGVVDSGYRGEIILKFGRLKDRQPVWWRKEKSNVYKAGDRIGQLMIIPYPKVEFIEVDTLSTTDRGIGGFGSTGE